MKKFYYLSMYVLFILAYINEIFPSEVSRLFLAFSVVMLVLSALSITRGFQLWVSLLSLAIGHFILFYNGYGFNIWLTSITKTVGIPVLFVCIPFIGYLSITFYIR